MKTSCTIAALLLMTLGTGLVRGSEAEGVAYEAFPAIVPVDETAEAIEQPTPLTLANAGAFQEGVNIVALELLSDADIAAADQRAAQKYADVFPGPARVGVTRTMQPGSLTIADALATKMDDDRMLWTLAIRSPGAYGMRLHFTGFDVGEGLALAYSMGDSGLIVRGPYTGSGPDRDGEFWTSSLPGDEVFIEIVGTTEPELEIADVVHFDQNVFGAPSGPRSGPDLLDCHLDVNCYDADVAWTAKMATGKMVFSDGTDSYVCTGTLLNDLDGETIVPYFLTARHCLSTQAEVDTLEVVWKYQTATCDDEASVPDYWSLPRNLGGLHMRSYDENDMEFIRLAGDLPGGLALAGWTETTSCAQYGVHHPKGSWKRVVFLEEAIIGCGTKDPTDYDSYEQIDGLTQKGSSGSGAFNGSGQLAGQLWGICSATTDPDDLSCSNIDHFWAVYGEFEESWSKIGWYLMIGGTMYVDAGSGCMFPTGTATCPYLTIEDAVNASWEGLRIKIEAGSYAGPLLFDEPLTYMAMNGTVTIGG